LGTATIADPDRWYDADNAGTNRKTETAASGRHIVEV